jgi:ABC-2 type transport system permease protein
MSIGVVARKDFQDAVRAKTLWVAVALFALAMSLSAWFFGDLQAQDSGVAGDALLFSLRIPTSILLPIIGIMIGYKAIVGERSSGTIKLLCSLPNTRSDVVVGKLLGRAGVVAVTVILGSVIGGVVFALFANSFPLLKFVVFIAMTIVIGVVFVSIAIGFSAATTSDTIAIVGGIGLVLLFTLLWDIFTLVLSLVLSEVLNVSGELATDVLTFTNVLNPNTSWGLLLNELFSDTTQSNMAALMGPDSFWLEPWFAVIVLLFWLVAPLAFGYWRFERAELG